MSSVSCPFCDRAFPPPPPPLPVWPPLQERLITRIEIGPPPGYAPELGPCWLWTGARNKDGYGTLNHVRAHRLVWELLVGPIPAGLVLDHLCRVTFCVCPRHLEPVTVQENTLRGVSAARSFLGTVPLPK